MVIYLRERGQVVKIPFGNAIRFIQQSATQEFTQMEKPLQNNVENTIMQAMMLVLKLAES